MTMNAFISGAFDTELGDPSHLDSLLSTIRGIDSVYDAYRVVPGRGV